MMLEISTRSELSAVEEVVLAAEGLNVIEHGGVSSFGMKVKERGGWGFVTQTPIIQRNGSNFATLDLVRNEGDLEVLQNEVSGVYATTRDGCLNLLVFSARMSRSRIYYMLTSESLYLSCDLRDIIHLSDKRVDLEIVFGILKFGEIPEFYSPIAGICAVPVGCSLALDGAGIKAVIARKEVDQAGFKTYHQISFPSGGGDLATTKSSIRNILSYLHRFRPGVLVSGGIDSSLINYLYNEVTDAPYPAFFFDFDQAPEEKYFVVQSLRGTQGELVPVRIHNQNVVEDFQRSVSKLIYPVYDAGSALVGEMFSQTLHSRFGLQLPLIDGTVADSCYGVRDYRTQLRRGPWQPEIYSIFKEWLFSKAELSGSLKRGTRPRDSFLHDEFLQDLLWYGGVYVNLWFPNAREHTRSLKERYYWYLNMLDPQHREDYWPRYSIMKTLLYAAKQTTVKVYDMLLPNSVFFPFMFKAIVEDQGRYTWQQKSEDGIIKAPLKKLLEGYAPREFIYRRKTGLQSQTLRWITEDTFRSYVDDLLFRRDSVASEMMRGNLKKLRSAYNMDNPPGAVRSLVLSLAVLQCWIDLHGLKVSG